MRTGLGRYVKPGKLFLARFPGTAGDYASAADHSSGGLTDFSALALVSFDDVTPAANNDLIGQWHGTTDRAFTLFLVLGAGQLRLAQTTDGATQQNSDASVTLDSDRSAGEVFWWLTTRVSATGAVNFYTADYVSGSVAPPAIGAFTQLGSADIAGPTGAIFDSTGLMNVGGRNNGTANMLDGDLYRALLYTGIYGSGSEVLVRDFNPSDAATTAATSWVASTTGETWTLNGGDVPLVSV